MANKFSAKIYTPNGTMSIELYADNWSVADRYFEDHVCALNANSSGGYSKGNITEVFL